jgi:hypothetical protein
VLRPSELTIGVRPCQCFSVVFGRWAHSTPNIPQSQNPAKTRSGSKGLRRLTFYPFIYSSGGPSNQLPTVLRDDHGRSGTKKAMHGVLDSPLEQDTAEDFDGKRRASSCVLLLSGALLLSMRLSTSALSGLVNDSPPKRVSCFETLTSTRRILSYRV